MHLLQLLLNLSDQVYQRWLESGMFESLRALVDPAQQAWDSLGACDYYHRLVLPALPDEQGSSARTTPDEPARYVRVALYLPLLSAERYARFRTRIGLGSAGDLNVSVTPFELNPLDVPESVHWHKMSVLLSAAIDQQQRAAVDSIYHNTLQPAPSEALRDAVTRVMKSNAEYVRQELLAKGRARVPCNSRFVLNLFLSTRDIRALRESWGDVTVAAYEQTHNALVAVARTRGWKRVVNTLIHGDPSIVHPFALFQEA